ncbi:unnamed protein product [Rotaria socialis]|uniref:Uncharacterized protein n=1 Tax=Rotaria socialis TaxID=392032 RepID=A0A817YKS0_9BILA|nr:unnamed protein product [Rotaria socialis]CAF4377535.1 unnamed protein product [Rotaria socialis]
MPDQYQQNTSHSINAENDGWETQHVHRRNTDGARTNTNRHQPEMSATRTMIREADDITKGIIYGVWYMIKPIIKVILCVIIVLAIFALTIYFFYTLVICSWLAQVIPFVHYACPKAIDSQNNIILPPVNIAVEKTASLADFLLKNTQVNAPRQFVRATTSIVELRAVIDASDIKIETRNELSTQFKELQTLVKQGGNELTSMVVSFGGTLQNLQISTKYVLQDLKEVAPKIEALKKHDIQSALSEVATRVAVHSFHDYISSMRTEIERIRLKAQKAYDTLEKIQEKLGTIEERHFWRWIFGKDEFNIRKYERTMPLFNEFTQFVRIASENVGVTIQKLDSFQSEIDELQYTAATIDEQVGKARLSVDMQTEQIEEALKRLEQSRAAFDTKSNAANQLE